MSIETLKTAHGARGKRRELINRAIRAELVGGEDTLEALDRLGRTVHALQKREGDIWQEQLRAAQVAHDATVDLRDIMALEIMRRYKFGDGK